MATAWARNSALLITLKIKIMTKVKGKETKGKSDKTAPAKNLKEKRAAKEAKRKEKANDKYSI